MNTIEAIEFLENGVGLSYEKTDEQLEKEYITKMDGVYALLKRGEKFEKMWEELYQDFVRNYEEHNISGYSYMVDMDNYKEKYFPKPEEVIDWKDRFYELEEEFEEKEKELTQHVEYWKFKFYGGK